MIITSPKIALSSGRMKKPATVFFKTDRKANTQCIELKNGRTSVKLDEHEMEALITEWAVFKDAWPFPSGRTTILEEKEKS